MIFNSEMWIKTADALLYSNIAAKVQKWIQKNNISQVLYICVALNYV